jgi:hypothetical protein
VSADELQPSTESTSPTPEDTPEARQARTVADKTASEIEKLDLEKQLLRRQLSRPGHAMEWLKAAAIPSALLGAAIALYVGFNQIRQSELNRDAERFDKALSRLAGVEASDRITGVAGLRVFISDSRSPFQTQALEYLVDHLYFESDESVESTILNVFKDLKKGQVNQEALNTVLKLAIEKNRLLTRSIARGYEARVQAAQAKVVARHIQVAQNRKTAPVVEPPFTKKLIDQLTPIEYLDYIAPFFDPFEKLEPKLGLPIQGLAQSVALFTRLGGANPDFSGIYCRGCDFAGTADLSGVKFDDAFLSEAQFTRVRLHKTSFVGAELGGTVFFAADLSEADLHRNPYETTTIGGEYEIASVRGEDYPILECAHLEGANLSGITLLTVLRSFGESEPSTYIEAPLLLLADIDSKTQMKSFTILYITDISDEYFLQHQKDVVVLPLRTRKDPSTTLGFDVPLRFNESSLVELWRNAGASVPANLQSTRISQIEPITLPLNSFGFVKNFLAGLTGYLDQPALLKLALIERFDKLILDSAPTGTVRPQPRWKANPSYSCLNTNAPPASQLAVQGKM